MTRQVSDKFLSDLESRLRVLHLRPVLVAAGVVNASGNYVKGDRKEEPMSEEAIQRIVGSYR